MLQKKKISRKKDWEWEVVNVVILNRIVKEDLFEKRLCEQRHEKVRKPGKQIEKGVLGGEKSKHKDPSGGSLPDICSKPRKEVKVARGDLLRSATSVQNSNNIHYWDGLFSLHPKLLLFRYILF